MNGRPWTEPELAELERQVIAERRSFRQVTLEGRTSASVRNKAWLLGLAAEREEIA